MNRTQDDFPNYPFVDAEQTIAQLQCPVACKETIFDPFISSTAISNTYVSSILRGNYSNFLKKKLLKAREAFEHFDYEQHRRNKHIITEFTNTVRQIKQAYGKIQDQTTKAMSYVKDTINDITPRLRFHLNHVLQYIKRMIEVNFIQGWELTDDRTLSRVSSKFYETMSMYDKTISQLLAMGQKDDPKREVNIHRTEEILEYPNISLSLISLIFKLWNRILFYNLMLTMVLPTINLAILSVCILMQNVLHAFNFIVDFVHNDGKRSI